MLLGGLQDCIDSMENLGWDRPELCGGLVVVQLAIASANPLVDGSGVGDCCTTGHDKIPLRLLTNKASYINQE